MTIKVGRAYTFQNERFLFSFVVVGDGDCYRGHRLDGARRVDALGPGFVCLVVDGVFKGLDQTAPPGSCVVVAANSLIATDSEPMIGSLPAERVR